MTDCAEVIALLSEFLDRDLPPETCVAMQAHLDTCAHCGAAAEGLRKTVGLCRDFRNQNLPGPLPTEKHRELKDAFQKALSQMRGASQV